LPAIISMMETILRHGWYQQSVIVGKLSVDLTDEEDARSRETAASILRPMLEAEPDKVLPIPAIPDGGMVVPVGGLGDKADPPTGKEPGKVTASDLLDYLEASRVDPDSIDQTIGAGRTRGLALDALEACGIQVEGVRFDVCDDLASANRAEAAANKRVVQTDRVQDLHSAADWLRQNPGAGYTALGRAMRAKNKGEAQRLHGRASLCVAHGVEPGEAVKVPPLQAAKLAKLNADEFPAAWAKAQSEGSSAKPLTIGQVKKIGERSNDALRPVFDAIANGDGEQLARFAGMKSDDLLEVLASIAKDAADKREREATAKAQAEHAKG
jgi:hypothetical protein